MDNLGDSRWERIRWPIDEPLPSAGAKITLATEVAGCMVPVVWTVTLARSDREPGWIQIALV